MITAIDIDGLEYVTGYVAKRFLTKYPCLSEESLSVNNEVNTNWTTFISKGHLIIPSQILMKAAKIMMVEFDKLHGDTLNGGENIMDTLTKTVMAHLEHKLPEEVVSCLVRTRTFIRFNQINKKINDNVHIKNKNKFKKFMV